MYLPTPLRLEPLPRTPFGQNEASRNILVHMEPERTTKRSARRNILYFPVFPVPPSSFIRISRHISNYRLKQLKTPALPGLPETGVFMEWCHY
jgi:hypothetical protein